MHLADRNPAWSPLNAAFEIQDAAAGRFRLTPVRQKLAICGAGGGRETVPTDDPDWEVWCLNLIPAYDSADRIRADRWFDIHQRHAQSADDLRWIASCPRPIYVPEDLLDGGPNCVRFPHELLEEHFQVKYWTCTFAYQIALAVFEGFTDIALCGVELSAGTRRERTVEWACVSWWMGFAEARGVVFHLPNETRLGTHPYRYGIEYTEELEEVNDYLRSTMGGSLEEMRREIDRGAAGYTGAIPVPGAGG